MTRPAQLSCKDKGIESAISQRAAEICTGALVGCSLSYEQVRAIVAEAGAAEACK